MRYGIIGILCLCVTFKVGGDLGCEIEEKKNTFEAWEHEQTASILPSLCAAQGTAHWDVG